MTKFSLMGDKQKHVYKLFSLRSHPTLAHPFSSHDLGIALGATR